ncbi:hypothetical protein M5E89_09970 [Acidaminococcus intestini]|nr:hypothetical protein M5E89_09970 [Acidaminococcus intestini]
MNRFLPKLSYPYDSILAKNRVNGHAKDWLSPLFDQKIDRKGKDSAKPEWEKIGCFKVYSRCRQESAQYNKEFNERQKGF